MRGRDRTDGIRVWTFADPFSGSSYNPSPINISRLRKIDWKRRSAGSYLSNARNWSS